MHIVFCMRSVTVSKLELRRLQSLLLAWEVTKKSEIQEVTERKEAHIQALLEQHQQARLLYYMLIPC